MPKQPGMLLWQPDLVDEARKRLKAGRGFLAAPPVAAGPVRSQPVVEGGRILVGTDDGKLVGINTENPKFTGWPMWGKDAAHSSVQESP